MNLSLLPSPSRGFHILQKLRAPLQLLLFTHPRMEAPLLGFLWPSPTLTSSSLHLTSPHPTPPLYSLSLLSHFLTVADKCLKRELYFTTNTPAPSGISLLLVLNPNLLPASSIALHGKCLDLLYAHCQGLCLLDISKTLTCSCVESWVQVLLLLERREKRGRGQICKTTWWTKLNRY